MDAALSYIHQRVTMSESMKDFHLKAVHLFNLLN